MCNNNLEALMDDISQQADTILDHVQQEILDPGDALNKLKKLWDILEQAKLRISDGETP